MYIREYMNAEVVTITGDASIRDAQKLMNQHLIRRLPVMEGGKLVGIITQDKIRQVASSPVTSPSKRELEHLAGEMPVRDAMERNVVTIDPDTTVEDAISLGQEHQVGALPVVIGDNQLVGIVTTTDLYKITVQALGLGTEGPRIHIYECSKVGRRFGEVLDIINKRGIRIRSMFHITPPGVRREDCIIHLDTDDVSDLLGELKVKGYIAHARPSVTPRYHNIVVRDEWEAGDVEGEYSTIDESKQT
jgi:acetoin utilization protein AcuB